MQNGQEIIQNLNKNLRDLNIGGNFVGKLDATTFENFKLKFLNLSNTQLSFDDLILFNPLMDLLELDISFNNLENVTFTQSKIFAHLTHFSASECRIPKIYELLRSFGPSLAKLDFSGNFLGNVNSSTFSHLTNLDSINLRNTQLSLDDLNLFVSNKHLYKLDISYNNLEGVNLSSMSRHSKELKQLRAAHCNITKAFNIKLFVPTLGALDLSGNFLGEIESTTFDDLILLYHLNLSNTNLSYLDFNLFKHQHLLKSLRISQNRLKEIDFTQMNFKFIVGLYLEENDLTEMKNFTLSRYRNLRVLSISRNQLSCEFLQVFVQQSDNQPDVKIGNI